MNQRRLCIVSHLYPCNEDDYKGIAVHHVAAELVRRGHKVHVVTPRRPGSSPFEVREGVRISRFRHYGWREGIQLGEFKRYPVMLLSTMIGWGIICCVWRILRTRADLVHACWVVPGGLMALISGKITFRPVVVTAAGSDLNIMARKKIAGRLVRFTLHGLDRLIAVGSEMKRIAVELGMPEKLGVVIPPVVSYANEGSNSETKVRMPGKPGARLLYVGNLTPPKRVDTMIRALARVIQSEPDAALTIVGDGNLRPGLETLAANLNLNSRIQFQGARPHEEIMDIMRSADIFVHCSDNEGLPVAISEALLAGRPVVASRVGGIPDLVREGVSGFLVEPDDDEAFAGHLLRLITDEPLRRAMSAKAMSLAAAYLEGGETIARIEQVYEDVLRRK